MAASITLLLHRKSYFQTEYYNSAWKYLVNILLNLFWEYINGKLIVVWVHCRALSLYLSWLRIRVGPEAGRGGVGRVRSRGQINGSTFTSTSAPAEFALQLSRPVALRVRNAVRVVL